MKIQSLAESAQRYQSIQAAVEIGCTKYAFPANTFPNDWSLDCPCFRYRRDIGH